MKSLFSIFSSHFSEKPYSSAITSFISSPAEEQIYRNAGLVEGTVASRRVLKRTDIDINQKEPWGEHRTNLERMEIGWAPIDKTNETIELHHIGQKPDSPLAELTYQEHRGKGNSGVLHKSHESEFYGENNRGEWSREQKQYWKERAKDFQK